MSRSAPRFSYLMRRTYCTAYSMRRFWDRPSAVSLLAFGLVLSSSDMPDRSASLLMMFGPSAFALDILGPVGWVEPGE